LADKESREFSEYKNGEEKKRNPRKERSRRKCLIHSRKYWQGQGKYFTMSFLEMRRRVPM
jgi:DNA-binding protein H-NS